MKKRWYILQALAGYETAAKGNLEAKIKAQGLEHVISRVLLPEEIVIDASAKSVERHVVSLNAKIYVSNGDIVKKGDSLAEEPSIRARRDGIVTDVRNAKKVVIETVDKKFTKTYVIPQKNKPVTGLKVGGMVRQGMPLSSDGEIICEIDGKIIQTENMKRIVVKNSSNDLDVYVAPISTFNSNAIKKGVKIKAGQIIAEPKKILAKSSGRVEITDFPTKKEIRIQKVKVRKLFPGYLFVEMIMNDEFWHFVRTVPGIIDFVSSGGRPLPLNDKEAKVLLRLSGEEEIPKEEKSKEVKIEFDFEIGDSVKIISGPFEGFVGTVKEINPEHNELKVTVTIFGRETPVTVHTSEVEKVV
ncbi:antitermination protein NusG [Thermosipho melanesiensis]|uniref:Transcription termination/antitermination protein NusG n=2 Tax=Thermosipho melanesiensis TaxID=46541 RepID=A6LKQ4_THEM4|nr:transcription termination/antitermination protein NusG [Thermosipho melanesiensis]ABR30505.1 NusG antitermination factor [Thermosipho melanesiensis BI429]APT73656.1 antitermination protein NusG [Thermosipho melanesiensis]OOC35598.1 antitermination protein NusG [Thermosipho melanesiensis]OOC39272.1 antitermination protein NusG [Thermosipho melanesiensis]OOC39358.1 antitermination protein NusG [Thermosipho melanesiensis]